jgi:cysteine dioxygenase
MLGSEMIQLSRAPLVTPSEQPLAQLLSELRALGDLRRRPATVEALLERLVLPPERLWPVLPVSRHSYARTRIHRDAHFELLLLTWTGRAHSPVHDHDGQDCWFLPLDGAFDLDDYAIAAEDGRRARLTLLGSRRLHAGEPGAAPQVDRRDRYQAIHAVRAATSRAISLHVYARPIDRCRVFDLGRGRWRWCRLTCDATASRLVGG